MRIAADAGLQKFPVQHMAAILQRARGNFSQQISQLLKKSAKPPTCVDGGQVQHGDTGVAAGRKLTPPPAATPASQWRPLTRDIGNELKAPRLRGMACGALLPYSNESYRLQRSMMAARKRTEAREYAYPLLPASNAASARG